MSELEKIKILVIVGPTASGKSDLAVHLAKQLDGEVISADSRQVYKGLDVGTGKITAVEMQGVRHHLLDVASPLRKFTVERYKKLAAKAIADIAKRGKLPIICGGTGFYIDALVDGIVFPDVPPNPKLRAELAKIGKKDPAALFAQLKELDPERAEAIDQHNLRRVIRAIEIATALGKVPKISSMENTENSSPYDPIFIGVNPDTETLRAKIQTRLIERIDKQGMVDEARALYDGGLSWKRMEELGLEYRYLALFLQQKITREKMIDRLGFEIWHYAKRQLAWFKRNKHIQWFESGTDAAILKKVRGFLEKIGGKKTT
ncbi:MAG: tRNA (adenosine(37)-N6)-dimethylallyltransferase MiaA [Patescibacteria group bacterium]